MNNISIISSCSSLKFLGDYVIGSVEMKSGSELNGEAIMRLLIDNEEYEMRVSMKGGKKEGVSLLVREDGTLFMRMMFVNDECEGEVTKMNEYGNIVLRGRVERGKEVGIWIEYDDYGNEIWRGLYRKGKRYLIFKEQEGMKGFFKEMNDNGELLSVSEYDEYGLLKDGKCFEYEGGQVVRECEYKGGRMIGVLRKWIGKVMIEYDVNGVRLYEGGFGGDIVKGFVREGKGKQYRNDGKRVLYVGGWKNGKREGYGSEFKDCFPVYIGEWKNGLRHGEGKGMNEKGEVIRSGRWIEGEYARIKRFEDGYGTDLRVFGTHCLQGVEKLEIGNDCYTRMARVVIDGLNALRSMKIGEKSFIIDWKIRFRSKCVIMNCDQLSEIHIGFGSFFWYESLELKNLPSLISIQLNQSVFSECRSVVFESMND